MDFLGITIIVMIAVLEIQGKSLDVGPQLFNVSSKSKAVSNQKRYATKEIILYLTPSQIKKLQERQGLLNPHDIPHLDIGKYPHDQAHPLPAGDEHNGHLHQPLVHPQPLNVPPVEEPHSDKFVPIVTPLEYHNSENFAYNYFQPQHQPNNKPVLFLPEPHEQAAFHGHKLTTLVPHVSHHENSQEDHVLREHLKEQLYRLLDQNRAHLQALEALSQYQKATEHNKELLQYAPKYNDQKYALDLEHLIGRSHQHQFEKQQALLQAEAIANSPPLLIHKEISIKHSPVQLIKQVKVPVPTPVYIPIPEPFEVKVPHPYPVPLEIIKPVPVGIEKHIPIPVTKNVFINVDRPHLQDHAIPLKNHAWQH